MLNTVPEAVVWAIFLVPISSFVIIGLVARRWPRFCGYLTIAAVAISFLLSLWVLDSVIDAHGHRIGFGTHEWLTIGSLTINLGLTVDGLTAVMLMVVTTVSLMVQIYSQGYMHGDPGYSRYYAFMSLFTAAMLGLVLAENLVMLFVFWEMVGLCSYLLIGFWFERPTAPYRTSSSPGWRWACLPVRWASRPSSLCTSGSPTLWRARRLCPP
jgi:NADH-quinone oxidoreductase subunit L